MFFAFNAMASDMYSQNDWKVLLETIIGNPIPFTLEFDEEAVLIHGSASDIKSIEIEIIRTLSNRKEFEKKLNYKIDSNNGSEVELIVHQEQFKLTSLQQGIKQFHALLGNAIEELSLNPKTLFSEKFGANIKDGFLCSRKFLGNSMQNYEDYRCTFLSYFSGQSVKDVRMAWTGGGPLEAPKERIDSLRSEFISLMENHFVIAESASGQFSLQINLEGIFKLCFPPSFEIIAAREASATLRINSEHLIAYLKQLILGDVLLRIVKDNEDVQIIPIILQQSIDRKNAYLTHHYLVIDRSGSMALNMRMLKNYLKEFVRLLGEEDKDSMATLVFFDDKACFEGPFAINDPQIGSLIDLKSTSGGTCLFGTLTKVFEKIKSR